VILELAGTLVCAGACSTPMISATARWGCFVGVFRGPVRATVASDWADDRIGIVAVLTTEPDFCGAGRSNGSESSMSILNGRAVEFGVEIERALCSAHLLLGVGTLTE
jgi:hypothetical protein